ncbi:MAG: 7-cyano-7-deazaguanine synthase QueC [OCS116 cluster bacterium]|uniref:7-cyano-7-deazaguanine synthase n=1 Tax=OCS116 cluster bacterium TaxID=2030921 RepID=A0A2A4Z215_9PROT|nr:7-cyano-7-deazaguanine synthase QueC [OCS116 cluster bacterium]
MQTLVICSGGMDSITLAHKIADQGNLSHILTFDYGQRHVKEIDFARNCAADLDVPFTLIDMSNIGKQFTGTALTGNVDVPDGHYAEASMKVTMVPNRNVIMLSIAYGLAATHKLKRVALAVHGGDHFIYPDCRPDFIAAFAKMQKMALEGYADIDIYAPYVNASKADIATDAKALNVDHTKSWSCYKGGDLHCGRCGTCVERREAFDLAGYADPTIYADPDFWQGVVEEAAS